MNNNETKKIFALLYEIKKKLTKIEKDIKTDEKSNQENDSYKSSDFTRGSTLW